MVATWPIIPIIDLGPIFRLCPKITTNFLRHPERICNAKGSESERTEKNERKSELKTFKTGNREKMAFARAPN